MAERVRRATLRCDVREVARARRVAADALLAWGDRAALPAVELLVSEMVGAAVRRATGDVELRLRSSGGEVLVEVDAPGGDAGGPSLWFVGDVAAEWGCHDDAGRTVTWARVASRVTDGAR